MMKQSKYSKRRPTTSAVVTKKTKKPQQFLDKYEIGIWLDDVRPRPTNGQLPEALEWREPKSYREFCEVVESISDMDPHLPKSIFVSFDHYLSKSPIAPTGRDCLVCLICELAGKIPVIHIEGHSSDPSMNEELMKYWKQETNY